MGQNPHRIWVRPRGHIDGRSEENNVWDEIIRTLIPKILNISVIEWDHHKPKSLDKLRASFDANFEYVGNVLFVVGFRNVVKRWLKI
jgi:hypothetical protein